VTINLPSKVPANTQFNVVANVQPAASATGTVAISIVNGVGFVPVPLVNGTATVPIILGTPGIYQIYAVYSGSDGSKGSQSVPVFVDATGSTSVAVTATTGPMQQRFLFPLNIE
jgi:hypothetical protein